jgi:cytochrome c-type biogenesis protein CcmH
MKNKNLIIIMCLLIQFNLHDCYAVEPNEILKNAKQEERARNISKNIRCMVCQNQSIDESSAPLAKDLRILIREQIKDKKKDDEIYKFLTDRYGDYILLKPPFKSNTLALWLLPLIFCTIGLFIIIINNKKSKKLIKNI